VDAWQEAPEGVVFEAVECDVGGFQLADGKGQEVEEGGAAGEGLGNCAAELQLVGAGEDEAAVAVFGVDDALDVAEEVGDSLDFVEDGRAGKLGEEGFGIGGGEVAGLGNFEVGVGGFVANGLGESGFSCLARTEEGDDRVFGEECLEFCRDLAGDHGARLFYAIWDFKF